MTTFKTLGLEDVFLQAIQDMGFETPSEVQEKTIPLLLQQETDLVSLAQTGTGKTAAFGFPMLQKIRVESRDTGANFISDSGAMSSNNSGAQALRSPSKRLECGCDLWRGQHYRSGQKNQKGRSNYRRYPRAYEGHDRSWHD